MYISYALNGRFGNNLFQYLATKVLQYKLSQVGLNYTYIFSINKNNCYIIEEKDYLNVLNNITNYVPFFIDKNIYLDGYFQYDSHIREYKEYITSSVCILTNIDRINNNYTVQQLMTEIEKYAHNGDTDNLTMHIRLDDFIPEKVCMKVGSYLKILKTIFKEHKFNNVTIIIDKINHKFEQDYVNCIYTYLTSKQINVVFRQSSLLEDFSSLYWAPYFLSSNSTFSYLAGLLGHHIKSWCPVNTRYEHQHISSFDENTESFSIEYVIF